MTAIGYWRQVSPVSEAARSLVDIRTVEPGTCPPPPMLPSSVPSHTKCFVEQAARAVKTAWLIESQRANYTGEEISDEQLNKTYKRGREWFAKHAATPEVGMSCPAYLPLRIYSHTHLDYLLLAWQMRTNSSVNASQKRSFDEQIGRGRKLPPKSRLGLARTHDRTLPKISQESSYRTWRACPLRPLATEFGTTGRRQRSGYSPRFLRRLKRTPTPSMSYRISSAPILDSQTHIPSTCRALHQAGNRSYQAIPIFRLTVR